MLSFLIEHFILKSNIAVYTRNWDYLEMRFSFLYDFQGDSGGALAANNQVIGIASWVIPCGKGYPDVYTKVYAYRDWIQTVMRKSKVDTNVIKM